MCWGEKRYYSLDYYLKETFHEKLYKLSLNAGCTCPNRTVPAEAEAVSSAAGAKRRLAASPSFHCGTASIRKSADRFQIPSHAYIAYFQAYTNTYGELEELKEIRRGADGRGCGSW